MVSYRRDFVPGGTYFFTVPPIVILPEHLHAIWILPERDADYPGRWRAIKSAFARAALKSGVDVGRNA